MSRDAWDEFSKTILVRYVLSYLCGTLYLDPSVSLKRIFAFSVGGLFSLSSHALTCLRNYMYEKFRRVCKRKAETQHWLQLIVNIVFPYDDPSSVRGATIVNGKNSFYLFISLTTLYSALYLKKLTKSANDGKDLMMSSGFNRNI